MLLVAALLALLGDPAAPRREAACGVRELRFFSGYAITLPRALCVERTGGPDYLVYELAEKKGATPFVRIYTGYAANFPYFAPPEGMTLTEKILPGERLCGELLVRETARGELAEIGGAVTIDGKRCGEVLVRGAAVNGAISSNALHFWYRGISEQQEKLVRKIIESVRRAEELPDDPPLKRE